MSEQKEHAIKDDAFEASLEQQAELNAKARITPDVANLAIIDEADRLNLELMFAQHVAGIESLPEDDFTVSAAVNALLLEKSGISTDELEKYELIAGTGETEEIIENSERTLTAEQTEQLLSKLEERFNANKKRHKGIEWSQVEARLQEAAPEKLWSLNEMERTGGEPDVVGFVEETGEVEFWDCSKESPEGRRMVCYDSKGQEIAEREGYNPKGNAVDMAEAMGLGGLLNEDQYRKMQKFGKFDMNTWSWIDTSEEVRKKGVALDALRNGDDVDVFEYSPGNPYDSGGFRGWLRV